MKAVHLPRTEIDHQTTVEKGNVLTWECVREGRRDSCPPSQHCHVFADQYCSPHCFISPLFIFASLDISFFHNIFFGFLFWVCSFPTRSVMSSLLREEMQRVLFRPGKQRLVEFIEIKEPAQGRHFLCVAGKWLFLCLICILNYVIPIPAKYNSSVYIFSILAEHFLMRIFLENILNVSEP